MRTKTILAFALFWAVRTASQEMLQPPRQAQCKFSDGSTITVRYSYERRSYVLATDGSLVKVGLVSVPPGDYVVSPARGSHDDWTFTMKKQISRNSYWLLPPFPMSVTTSTSTLPIGSFTVSFDQTGGSCMMYWSQKNSDTLLSMEFTEKNADLPVLK
jgi:hypothetical protein